MNAFFNQLGMVVYCLDVLAKSKAGRCAKNEHRLAWAEVCMDVEVAKLFLNLRKIGIP